MSKPYEGLPAAANLQQSIILAQLQILRRMQAARAGRAGTIFPQPGTATGMAPIQQAQGDPS